MKKNYLKNPVVNVLIGMLLVLMMVGCEKTDPISANLPTTQKNVIDKVPNFLKLKNQKHTFNKPIEVREWISAISGGQLMLQYGSEDGSQANYFYAYENNSPYNIYLVNPADPEDAEPVGHLAFASRGIALHPVNGLVYYVSKYRDYNGLWRLATWNPETNANVLLPGGTFVKPAYKLAFGPDGTLYGVKDEKDNSNKLYTIDINTGEWSYLVTCNAALDYRGDLVFDKDGNLYNLNAHEQTLQLIDLTSGNVTTVAYFGESDISGLSFGHDGILYAAQRETHKIFAFDLSNGDLSYLGTANMDNIEDLCPVIALTEFSYVHVTLDVLPGAINEDTEFSLSLNTDEISGGCFVTFEPHGTVFNTPAILNLEAHGVDFSGVDPSTIDIYYDNPDTGVWEPMVRDSLIVDVNAGTVQVINALLPHFSRYGVAAD